jgi:hypothetical protein
MATLGRMSSPRPPAPATLWRVYAEHAAIYMAGGPAPSLYLADRGFLSTSGSPHVDLNQAVLFDGATEADARDLVGRILAAGVPVLFGCSEGVSEIVAPVLREAGFEHSPLPEQLFWMPGAPSAPDDLPFDVRRVETDDDVAAMQSLFEAAHGYEPELTGSLFGDVLRTDDAATGWIAWDGPEAVSFAIVTRAAGSLSLWVVMTPPRHRRRGAGRTVVAAALDAVAGATRAAGPPIEQTLFWSSPAGRPLYEAMGFAVADTVDLWTLGASEADLIAVGVITG